MSPPVLKERKKLSLEEYLALERRSLSQKHEYVDGDVFSMAGASLRHNIITANILTQLSIQLKGRPCRPLGSDMKVTDKSKRSFLYPDLLVYCGNAEVLDEYGDVLLNPKVIIEVLSPSTENYDRSEKFFRYQRIESLSDYLLVSQDKPFIEYRQREQDGRWFLQSTEELDGVVVIESILCNLALRNVYGDIDFGGSAEG